MAFLPDVDFFFETVRGRAGFNNFTKYQAWGTAAASDTNLTPITTQADIFQPSARDVIYLTSTSASDTSAGSGARTVDIVGCDGAAGSFALVTNTVSMNGTGATSNTSNYFQRIIPFLCRVATTGSYQQNLVDPSQRGTISILSAFGGGPFTWGKITLGAGSDASGSGKVNGAFVCVPAGYTAYVRNLTVTADSTTAFVVQYRGDWSDTSAPYSPVEMLAVYDRVSGTQKLMSESETIKLPAKSEMWVAAKSRIGGTTASVSATFEVYLIATAE